MRKLLRQAKRAGACDEALNRLKQCKTLEEAADHPDSPFWAYWARRNLELPKLVKMAVDRKILESPLYSARIIASPVIVEEVVEELFIRRACDDPQYAWRLHMVQNAWNLPDWVRYLAECRMLENPAMWMHLLGEPRQDLDPRTVERLIELGVMLPEEDAQPAPA